ncbi:TadE/TadG family type IV pilus assembly protein [Luteibacter yeojuensis]|uniref:Pilus assembly protein n=1 Tax=Luteibacter yeojuensis TaxID=345309 RepID=A0A7X5TNP7_9GAMM|nr:TadE/TadG family type IV pilus assembly protein [Luteibacter yeojuensis]NID13998.1 pilus assembly protein [Luteibacter yeojuensis]
MMSRRQRGQSITEFLVTMFGFGFLLLGLFQAILFYRAKATVDYAALEAARAGAVHGASKASLREGLARGLAPLYAAASGNPGKAGAALAFLDAKKDILLGTAKIEVLAPTRAAWQGLKQTQYDGKKALPNDSLYFRNASAAGVSVQDANLLKIRVTYDYPLIVPVIDRMLAAFQAFGGPAKRDLIRSATRGRVVYSLPIQSTAMVRMQSPVTDAGNLAGGP